MKTAVHPQFGTDVAGTPHAGVPSVPPVTEVLSSAAYTIQLIQANAGATLLARSVENFRSAFSPTHAPYWLQQLPLHYRLQAATLMASAADTYSEGLQAQQALLACAGQWCSPLVLPLADASHSESKPTPSRRLSRQVIEFPNRRVA